MTNCSGIFTSERLTSNFVWPIHFSAMFLTLGYKDSLSIVAITVHFVSFTQ